MLLINPSTCLPVSQQTHHPLNLRACSHTLHRPLPSHPLLHPHIISTQRPCTSPLPKHCKNTYQTCLRKLQTPPILPLLLLVDCCVVLCCFGLPLLQNLLVDCYMFSSTLLPALLHWRPAGIKPKPLPQTSAGYKQCKASGKHRGRTGRIASGYVARHEPWQGIRTSPRFSRALAALASLLKCWEGLPKVRTLPAKPLLDYMVVKGRDAANFPP